MLLKVNKSLNFSKKPRSLRAIKYLIIHYSGMQSGRVSMDRLKNPKSKVSCHYFIERRGNIYPEIERISLLHVFWAKIEEQSI